MGDRIIGRPSYIVPTSLVHNESHDDDDKSEKDDNDSSDD